MPTPIDDGDGEDIFVADAPAARGLTAAVRYELPPARNAAYDLRLPTGAVLAPRHVEVLLIRYPGRPDAVRAVCHGFQRHRATGRVMNRPGRLVLDRFDPDLPEWLGRLMSTVADGLTAFR